LFRNHGLPQLVSAKHPESDASLSWISRHANRAAIRNELSLPLATRRAIRAFDMTFASLAILALSPVFLVVALAIKLESRGPVFYKQVRTGRNLRSGNRRSFGNIKMMSDRRRGDRRFASSPGRPFLIYKFRSMICDAERNGIQLAKKDDRRITRVGRFIRRTRIDEIPQFINVLKGDMSVVGPRPERPEIISYLEEQIPGYVDRLGVRPGITGLAQIRNGYDTDLEHIRRKIALDKYYIQKCSLVNDIKIILRTFRVVIKGEGAM
jgi:lipopolysaccharide/colanic/teichoic acid biosynthesis glycosyltransferase